MGKERYFVRHAQGELLCVHEKNTFDNAVNRALELIKTHGNTAIVETWQQVVAVGGEDLDTYQIVSSLAIDPEIGFPT